MKKTSPIMSYPVDRLLRHLYLLRKFYRYWRVTSSIGVVTPTLVNIFRKVHTYTPSILLGLLVGAGGVYLYPIHRNNLFVGCIPVLLSLTLSDKQTAIGVVRVSTQSQSMSRSPRSQRELIQKSAEQDEWILAEVLDFGWESGRTFIEKYEEPILQAVKKHRAKRIYFSEVDRYTRDLGSGEILVKKLLELGVVDVKDSTGVYNLRNRSDRLMLQIRMAMSQYYGEEIREKTSRGRRVAMAKGEWPFPTPPFGWDKDNDGRLRLKKETKRWGADAFKIFERTKNASLTSRDIKENYGIEISRQKLVKFLQNPICQAVLKLRDRDEVIEFGPFEHLRVVDDGLFERVQKHLGGNTKPVQQTPLPEDKYVDLVKDLGHDILALLDGAVWDCPRCGSRDITRDGHETVSGTRRRRFVCKKCGYKYRCPLSPLLRAVNSLTPLRCPHDGVRNVHRLEKARIHIPEGHYDVYQCRECEDGFISIGRSVIEVERLVLLSTPTSPPPHKQREDGKGGTNASLLDFIVSGSLSVHPHPAETADTR